MPGGGSGLERGEMGEKGGWAVAMEQKGQEFGGGMDSCAIRKRLEGRVGWSTSGCGCARGGVLLFGVCLFGCLDVVHAGCGMVAVSEVVQPYKMILTIPDHESCYVILSARHCFTYGLCHFLLSIITVLP